MHASKGRQGLGTGTYMATWNINLLQLPNSHPIGYTPEFISKVQGKQFAFHFQQSSATTQIVSVILDPGQNFTVS
jgi:hypothetical protein